MTMFSLAKIIFVCHNSKSVAIFNAIITKFAYG